MKKVKFINKSKKLKCWGCKDLKKADRKKCTLCKGTEKWTEDFYHLIYTNKEGLKLSFGVDSFK